MYDPERAAAFYDEYGESEWTRFEERLELDLGSEPGAIDGGEHMLAVMRKT